MVKLLIGIVTYGKQRYCLDEFIEGLTAQRVKADVLFVVNNGESAYATLLRSKNFNAVEDPKPASTRIDKIVNGRNFVRDYALKNGYSHLLFVDSDVILPKNAVVFLFSSKADIVSGVYLSAFELSGKKVIAPVVFKDLGNGECQLFTYEGVSGGEVLDVGAAGLGCVLISRKVLEAVPFRSFGNSQSGGEDMAFFVDSRAKGFKPVVHCAVKCIHRPYPKDDPRAPLFEWHKSIIKNPLNTDVKIE